MISVHVQRISELYNNIFFKEEALSIFIFSSFVRTDDICCHVVFVERCR